MSDVYGFMLAVRVTVHKVLSGVQRCVINKYQTI